MADIHIQEMVIPVKNASNGQIQNKSIDFGRAIDISSDFTIVSNRFSSASLYAYLVNQKIIVFHFFAYAGNGKDTIAKDEHIIDSSVYNSSNLIGICKIQGLAFNDNDTDYAIAVLQVDSTGLYISNLDRTGKRYIEFHGTLILKDD